MTESGQLKVFVSYSHKDSYWLERLKIHLRPLGRDHSIDLWEDTRIRLGSRWQEEVFVRLAETIRQKHLVQAKKGDGADFPSGLAHQENFLDHRDWTRLISIGD